MNSLLSPRKSLSWIASAESFTEGGSWKYRGAVRSKAATTTPLARALSKGKLKKTK
jgi:hypothetical protein